MKGYVERDYMPQRRNEDPAPSHIAAARVTSREGGKEVIRKGTDKHRVLAFVLQGDGAAQAADAEAQISRSADKRISDLVRDGYIEPSGERINRHGSVARTFRVTPKGKDILEVLAR